MSRPHANAFSVDEDESLLICQTYTVGRAFLERKKVFKHAKHWLHN